MEQFGSHRRAMNVHGMVFHPPAKREFTGKAGLLIARQFKAAVENAMSFCPGSEGACYGLLERVWRRSCEIFVDELERIEGAVDNGVYDDLFDGRSEGRGAADAGPGGGYPME